MTKIPLRKESITYITILGIITIISYYIFSVFAIIPLIILLSITNFSKESERKINFDGKFHLSPAAIVNNCDTIRDGITVMGVIK